MNKYTKKTKVIIISSLILLMLSIILSMTVGSFRMSIIDIFTLSFLQDDTTKTIFLDIRLPRILNILFIGAALACSGNILQSLLQNNLAEPGIIGISAGAGLGAIIMFLIPNFSTYILLTPVAFIFAMSTTFLIFAIAKALTNKYTNFLSSNKIILAGIAINALLSAANGLLLIVAGKANTQIIFWLTGGVSGKGWFEFFFSAPFIIIGIIIAFLIRKELGILSTGIEIAQSLGVSTKRIQIVSILTASLLAAAAVSVAGIIVFVGLIIPNIAKLILQGDNKNVIVVSTILGSIFMVLSDLLARTLIAPAEIPVGIITSFIGAPVFIWLIIRNSNIV
ncbi:MAG: FecCD family ABC transporter permease [Ignavibacteria bacterium]